MRKDTKQAILLCLGLLGVLMLVVWFMRQTTSPVIIEKASAKGDGWPTAEQEEARIKRERAKRERRVTLFEFYTLKSGMTYSKVVEIVGDEGEERSSNDVGDYHTVVYVWQNPNGSNMNATFQNGRLVSKAQFGLK